MEILPIDERHLFYTTTKRVVGHANSSSGSCRAYVRIVVLDSLKRVPVSLILRGRAKREPCEAAEVETDH